MEIQLHNPENVLQQAQARYGIISPRRKWLTQDMRSTYAMDAQPQLITTTNAGIPAYLANYLDPNVIRVLTTANKASLIGGKTDGEAKLGDWTFDTAQFPVTEPTGHVSSYSDFGSNGVASSNTNWPVRESYHFEVTTIWGDRELDRYGNARINRAAEIDMASVMTIDKFFNKTYLYGVAGRLCYGYLNDPNLSAPIQPLPDASGNLLWSQKVGNPRAIYSDGVQLFRKLVSQIPGYLDENSPMLFVMSNYSGTYFNEANDFGVTARKLLKENYPNAEFLYMPEYQTAGGNLIQLYAPDLDGTKTAQAFFTEKMRAFPVVRHASHSEQKKAAGTWGAIIKRPVAVAQMLGV